MYTCSVGSAYVGAGAAYRCVCICMAGYAYIYGNLNMGTVRPT